MVRKTKVFVKRKVRKTFENAYSKKDIECVGEKPFVVISNNCWGGALYRWYKRPYNSPFVGLFLYGPCYMKMLSNFEHYINQDLVFINNSKYPDREKTYPLALLDDVEVHFTHYHSEEEARLKWERRASRMLEETTLDNYFFKICDREKVTKEHILAFHKLPFKNKISFANYDTSELKNKNHIKVKERQKMKKQVPNGKKMFQLTFLYFDLNEWLIN